MKHASNPRAQTTGSARFDPNAFFESWAKDSSSSLPRDNDLRLSIITAFNLAKSDGYVYHAIAGVTLAQVQEAIEHGGENGMHAWYPDEDGEASEVSALRSVLSPSLIVCASFSSHHSFLLHR